MSTRASSGLFLLVFASAFLLPSTDTAARELWRPTAERPFYYAIEPDLRRCPSPVCGGFFIRAVNRRITHCADGTLAPSCYVADIDFGAIGLNGSEGASLVLGTQEPGDFPGFPDLAVLVPEAAWRPASAQEPRGKWVGLKDNGLVCVTEPCFYIEQRKLNRKRFARTISEVDLSRVDATDEDLEAAWQALENDELIAVGGNRRVREAGPAGRGLEFVASQFYVRLDRQRELDRDLFCTADDQCVATAFDRFVSSPDDCYCPLCPGTVLNREAERRNRESFGKFCPGLGLGPRQTPLPPTGPSTLASPGLGAGFEAAPIRCPVALCFAPPPVACVESQCTFLEPLPF